MWVKFWKSTIMTKCSRATALEPNYPVVKSRIASPSTVLTRFCIRFIQLDIFNFSCLEHRDIILHCYIYICVPVPRLWSQIALSSSLTLLRPPWLRPDLYLLYLIKLIQFLVYSSHNLTWLYSCIYMHTDI